MCFVNIRSTENGNGTTKDFKQPATWHTHPVIPNWSQTLFGDLEGKNCKPSKLSRGSENSLKSHSWHLPMICWEKDEEEKKPMKISCQLFFFFFLGWGGEKKVLGWGGKTGACWHYKILKCFLLSIIYLSVDIWNLWVLQMKWELCSISVTCVKSWKWSHGDVPFPEPFWGLKAKASVQDNWLL